jgi:hypothetical protein
LLAESFVNAVSLYRTNLAACFAAQVSRHPLGSDLGSIFMRTGTLVAVILISGCGTATLDRAADQDDPCRELPASSMPDLAITSIVYRPHMRAGVTVEGYPTQWVAFRVSFRNAGLAGFRGSVWLRFAENPEDLRSNRFPVKGEIKEFAIRPGDSAEIQYDKPHAWCKSGSMIRFQLLTDSNPQHLANPEMFFGIPPACEVSYANNTAEYIVR